MNKVSGGGGKDCCRSDKHLGTKKETLLAYLALRGDCFQKKRGNGTATEGGTQTAGGKGTAVTCTQESFTGECNIHGKGEGEEGT